MENRHTFRLGFITDTDQQAYISVPHAVTDATDTQVKAAMNKLIATGIIRLTNGRIVEPESATLISVASVEFPMT